MQQPPLLPEQVLARIHRLARRNGMSILIVASIGALLQAASHDTIAAIAGLLATGTGAMEVHGSSLLRNREKRGMALLIRAELLLLLVILVFCALRLKYPQLAELRAAFHASLEMPGMRARWEELGIAEDVYVHLMNQIYCIVLALVSFAYQGGMAFYYARRRQVVETALDA